MAVFNIYMTGVGGQGIGLFSEILLRAADHAGLKVKGVDTHGLAQRGGIVVSKLRIGEKAHSPLIRSGKADLAAALERHEALRAMNTALKDGGTLIYYDAVWQPLEVRMQSAQEISPDLIRTEAEKRGIRVIKVFQKDLTDARRQNIVLLAGIDREKLIPGVSTEHYRKAMDDLMEGRMLEENMALFESELKG